MGQLENMAMFIRIVEAGSISKAADQLNIAKSAVSRRLNELEASLNTQLISRTTRTSSLTDSGQQYYLQAKGIVEAVTKLDEDTRGQKAKLEGTLKMSAPLSFGLMHLSQLIDSFAREHSGVKFHLDFSDRHIDLVQEGFEMAIRIGKLTDSSLQAKKLSTIRLVLCASPDYLATYGTPKTPAELANHTFLDYELKSESNLSIIDAQGQALAVEIKSRIKANNGDFLKQMAVKGHGITCMPTFLTYQELARGELVTILDDCQLPELYAYAVYPRNRFLSQRCRRLIDFIAEKLGDQPYWDQTTLSSDSPHI